MGIATPPGSKGLVGQDPSYWGTQHPPSEHENPKTTCPRDNHTAKPRRNQQVNAEEAALDGEGPQTNKGQEVFPAQPNPGQHRPGCEPLTPRRGPTVHQRAASYQDTHSNHSPLLSAQTPWWWLREKFNYYVLKLCQVIKTQADFASTKMCCIEDFYILNSVWITNYWR